MIVVGVKRSASPSGLTLSPSQRGQKVSNTERPLRELPENSMAVVTSGLETVSEVGLETFAQLFEMAPMTLAILNTVPHASFFAKVH